MIVEIIVDGKSLDDMNEIEQLDVRNKLTDKVEVWVCELIRRRAVDGGCMKELEEFLI